MRFPTSGRTTSRSTRPISTSKLLGDTRIGGLKPPISFPPSARVLAYAGQALPKVIPGIVFVLAATFERPHPCVPLVVSAHAVARARHAECGIASRQIRLGVDHLHHSSRLSAFDRTDEWPEQMQRELDFLWGIDAQTAVWFPRRLRSLNSGDPS